MILSKPTVSFIKNKLIKTANLLGIESVIIEKTRIRAMDEKQTTVILHDHDMDIPFESIGLGRLSLLNSRLSLAKDEDITVDAIPDERSPTFITRLDIKAKKFKVDYRAANPAAIKAPKGFKSSNDAWFCKVELSEEDLDLLIKASNSMPQKTDSGSICMMGDPATGGMMIVLTDTNSDSFEMMVEGKVEFNTSDKIIVNYPLKQFLTLIKNNDGVLIVGDRNLLKTTVNSITILVFPIQ